MRQWLWFFLRWLKSPRNVGSVVPSSPVLAKAIANQIDTSKKGTVIEIGPGTGSFTKALLSAGVKPESLLLIEYDKKLCSILKKQFPNLTIIQGNAKDLGKILEKQSVKNINCLISGLPLLSIKPSLRDEIISEMLCLLKPNGPNLLQFTYGFKNPIPLFLLKKFNCHSKPVKRIKRNIPPAMIWQYYKDN